MSVHPVSHIAPPISQHVQPQPKPAPVKTENHPAPTASRGHNVDKTA